MFEDVPHVGNGGVILNQEFAIIGDEFLGFMECLVNLFMLYIRA